MAVTKVTGSNALTNYLNKKKTENATVSTNSGGTSLVAGANALSNSTNKSSGGGSSYVSTPSGMTLVNGANALSNAINNNSSNSATSVGGSSSGNSQYTGLGTYNDAGVSEWAKQQIDAYKAQYNEAAAKGDRDAMDAAHAAAEAIRERYGYSGGVDGSGYIELEQDEFEFDEEKPQYESKYDPRIEALLNEILNRGDFSYDIASDPLYKQYAQMYQREGDRAMKETLAEAAASAGGMNTYAITAAQQANSYYGSQLNDRIPELYQLAYEMYLNDKESKVQDLGLLQNMDATQYNRYRDTMNDWYNDRNFAYGMYRDDVGDSQWLTNLDYNDYWANKNYDNSNYWANKEFDYNDTWKNKEWDATQSDKEYDRNLYDQESAKDEVWKYIELGITPSAELIAKAGMSESDVNLAVAAVKAEQTKTTTSSSTSTKNNNNNNNNNNDNNDNNDGNDGNGNDMSDYTVTNNNAESWVHVSGLGRLSWQELAVEVERGTVTETVDNKNKKITYSKA